MPTAPESDLDRLLFLIRQSIELCDEIGSDMAACDLQLAHDRLANAPIIFSVDIEYDTLAPALDAAHFRL